MNVELYFAFVVATAVLIVIPGPNVALIVVYSSCFIPARPNRLRS